nr:MAG TPA: hypothetical protein [Caudoviricetes sp.]
MCLKNQNTACCAHSPDLIVARIEEREVLFLLFFFFYIRR